MDFPSSSQIDTFTPKANAIMLSVLFGAAITFLVMHNINRHRKPIPFSGRFDVSVHYEDNDLKVYTILDTAYCKNYIATTAGGLEFLEINKPCLNRKEKRNQ
jgi:hypothetical protein